MRLSSSGPFDRIQENAARGALEQVPIRATADRIEYPLVSSIGGEYEHADVRVAVCDGARGLDTVHTGHPKVHEYDIGPQLRNLFDRFCSIVGDPDDLKLRVALDDRFQALTHDPLIVTDQDSNHATPHM